MHHAIAAQKAALGVSSPRYQAFRPCVPNANRSSTKLAPRPCRYTHTHRPKLTTTTAQAANDKNNTTNNSTSQPNKAEEKTLKFGLEAGLWEVFSSQNNLDGKTKGEQAKELLKKYGSAYLITSISFAIVSFAACYALVASGVDVGAVLAKIGLQVTDTSEKVGTFAIAYAAHKALSPVRFPPTVALTPAVAKWLGKEVVSSSSDSGDAEN